MLRYFVSNAFLLRGRKSMVATVQGFLFSPEIRFAYSLVIETLKKSKSPMIRMEETTKRSQNERCLSFATSMPPQNFIKSSFHRYSRKREMLVADKAFWQTPQRSFCNYVTKPARPFISPTRSVIARHTPSPPFSRTL